MGENTKISWSDHTWNPWIGCARISPACDNCYADAMMGKGRFRKAVWGGPGEGVGTRVRTSPTTWREPLKWNRKAEAAGVPAFVFCASLADIFDNHPDVAGWRRDAFARMRETPWLVYLLLTKRPGNIVPLAEDAGGLPPNAAIGCTVESPAVAAREVRKLLAAKVALRPLFAFLSLEPLLAPIDLTRLPVAKSDLGDWPAAYYSALHADDDYLVERGGQLVAEKGPLRSSVDWVITGAESDQAGAVARFGHPDWFASIEAQCHAAGVPYQHKQNGPYLLGEDGEPVRVGLERAGRQLNGREYDGRPIIGNFCPTSVSYSA